MSIDAWKKLVGELLRREYAITLDDAGLDDDELKRQYNPQQDPADFVRWFATKYDLTSRVRTDFHWDSSVLKLVGNFSGMASEPRTWMAGTSVQPGEIADSCSET